MAEDNESRASFANNLNTSRRAAPYKNLLDMDRRTSVLDTPYSLSQQLLSNAMREEEDSGFKPRFRAESALFGRRGTR